MRKNIVVILALILITTGIFIFKNKKVIEINELHVEDVTEIEVLLLGVESDIGHSLQSSDDIRRAVDMINSFEYIPTERPQKIPEYGTSYDISGKKPHYIVIYRDRGNKFLAKYDGRWYKIIPKEKK